MKNSIFIIFFLLVTSCNSSQKNETNASAIWKEINETRKQFWAFAREGKLDSMLSFHLDSPEYSLYENGHSYDRKTQADGHKNMKIQDVSSINFNVQIRDSLVFSNEYVMETWDGTTDVSYHSGKKDTTEMFIVTVIYKKTEDGWKFRYIHSSDQSQ